MKQISKLVLFALIATLLPYSVWAADLGPTASVSVSPTSGSLNTTFVFDASASVDSRGFHDTLEYRWNFSAGNLEWTAWDDDPVVTYQYDDTGTHSIELEVRDEDGYTDLTWSQVSVEEEIPYEVEFNVTPEEGTTETIFTFDADLTTNINYPISDFSFRWDFDGDGSWDTDYMSSEGTTHTYGDANIYYPVLEVLAPDDTTTEVVGYETDSESSGGAITVRSASGYPEASIDYYPSSGDENTRFYFSAENSSHEAKQYRWDFQGDGIFDTEWSTDETADYKYGVEGEYEVILQVKDDEGDTDEARVSITIAGDGFAPEAKISVTSDSKLADKDVGTTATEFTFNASSSSDEEDYSSQLEVRWDYEGDGDFDTTFSTDKYAYHQYLEDGEYEVTVEVKDTDGNVSEGTYDIRVVENTPPRADFDVDPTSATPGVEFDFDAGSSADDQYKPYYLEVRWDFEGDGDWDTSFSTDKTESHYYDNSGTYDVVLQVKDPEGQTDEASMTVTILSQTAPTASFTADPTSGDYSTKFTFDASVSYDGQTDFDDLWFRWDFTYNGSNDITYDTSWSHNESTTHYFDEDDGTGQIKVKVEVKDEDGDIATASQSIWLHWASEYLEDLRSKGIMKGYDGDMAPDQNITRAELLKIVIEAMDENLYGMTYQGYFDDVEKTDWHWKYAELGYELGIIDGGGNFRPNDYVNRAEAVKIIVQGFGVDTSGSHTGGVFDDVSVTDWFFKYIMTAYETGLVGGYDDGTFKPGNNMTRGEAAKVVSLGM